MIIWFQIAYELPKIASKENLTYNDSKGPKS